MGHGGKIVDSSGIVQAERRTHQLNSLIFSLLPIIKYSIYQQKKYNYEISTSQTSLDLTKLISINIYEKIYFTINLMSLTYFVI